MIYSSVVSSRHTMWKYLSIPSLWFILVKCVLFELNIYSYTDTSNKRDTYKLHMPPQFTHLYTVALYAYKIVCITIYTSFYLLLQTKVITNTFAAKTKLIIMLLRRKWPCYVTSHKCFLQILILTSGYLQILLQAYQN